MDLKERILEFRAKNNLSQQKFAEMCKVTQMTINSIERGLQSASKLTEAKIEIILKGGKIND